MTICPLRSAFCCILAVLLPVSTLSAQNTPAGGAILSSNGIVAVNGVLIKDSSALADNDTVSTGPESVVHITSPGSNTLLASESIAAYSHDAIRLSSGAVSIATSNGMYTQVHKLKFAPANPGAFTKYEVRIDRCEVTTVARTGSVSLPDGKILAQGDNDRRIDKDCAAAVVAHNGIPASPLAGLSPVGWTIIGGAAAGGLGTVLLLGSGGGNPLSPAAP
jgi:hypothetical protein